MQEGEMPNEATLTTDQEDYPPYSYVYITGTGFQPGETVNMIVVELDPTQAVVRTVARGGRRERRNPHELVHLFRRFYWRDPAGDRHRQSSRLTASATFTDNRYSQHLYENAGRTINRDAFAWGATVYLGGNPHGTKPKQMLPSRLGQSV